MDNLNIKVPPVVQARLEYLLKSVYANIANGTYTTQEQLNKALFQVVRNLVRGPDAPLYELERFFRGTSPEKAHINENLVKIFNELTLLSDILFKTGTTVESNFNFAVSKIRVFTAKLKQCSQTLSAYSLYLSDDANSHHFGETFSSLDYLDKGSKFLTEEECIVNTEEGTLSLPADGNKQVRKIDKVSLGERSNCVLGNNVQAKTPVRGRINALHDANVDTWTEFERVVKEEDTEHISVELKFSLQGRQIVNGIRIIPVFLGARTPPVLKNILISEDGYRWKDISEFVSVADFLDEDESERFHLSPHSGKFSGEFNVTFPPRVVKLAKILITQSSAYTIFDTSQKKRLRYAVGLKEVEFYGQKYQDTGEIFSKGISFPKPIKAVGIRSAYDPKEIPPEAGIAEYSISFDDGTSWLPISRQKDDLLNIPEILFPPDNQTSLRYKIKINKNESAYAAYKQETAQEQIHQLESWGDSLPLRVSLLQKPAEGTLTICDPDIGSVGRTSQITSLGLGTTSSYDATNSVRIGASTLRRELPLPVGTNTKNVNILVDRKEWERVSSFDSETWNSEVYKLETLEDGVLEVVFGNGDVISPKGAIPTSDQKLSLYISDEQLTIETITDPYIATLNFPSNGEKSTTQIYAETEGTYVVLEVPSQVKEYKLPIDRISFGKADDFFELKSIRRTLEEYGFSEKGVFYFGGAYVWDNPTGAISIRYYKEFVDGHSELEKEGDWTIDFENATLYFYEELPSGDTFYFSCLKSPKVFLTEKDWDFVEGSLNQIQIYKRGYYNLERYVLGNANDNSKVLPKLFPDNENETAYGIVPKSVRITPRTVFGTSNFPFEVPFVNGTDEFEQKGLVEGEIISTSEIDGDNAVHSFTLAKEEDFHEASPLLFSDTDIFANQISPGADPTAQGEWNVNVSTGLVKYWLDNTDTLDANSTVSYLYNDADSTERFKGAYSVDAKNGIVHFSSPAEANYTVNFKQAAYKIRYVMSHQLEEGKEKDYTIDKENNEIVIRTSRSPGKKTNISIRYKYIPEEEEVFNLADHFSPLIRGIAIKAALL